MIGATYSVPLRLVLRGRGERRGLPGRGLRAHREPVLRTTGRRLGQHALAAEERARRRRLRQQVPLRVRDRRLDLRHGGEAVLDLLQRRKIEEVGQAQIVWIEHSHSDAKCRGAV
jgi:hypothetical protein